MTRRRPFFVKERYKAANLSCHASGFRLLLLPLQRIFGNSDAFDCAAVVIKAARLLKDVMMQLHLINSFKLCI